MGFKPTLTNLHLPLTSERTCKIDCLEIFFCVLRNGRENSSCGVVTRLETISSHSVPSYQGLYAALYLAALSIVTNSGPNCPVLGSPDVSPFQGQNQYRYVTI